MDFLEASRIIEQFEGGPSLRFRLAMSGSCSQMEPYIRACAAQRGRTAEWETLPFNTLRQAILNEPPAGREVFLLLPWDFVPEADWRTGLPTSEVKLQEVCRRALEFSSSLESRPNADFLFLSAPIPPLFSDSKCDRELSAFLDHLALSIGATIYRSGFSLATYLASGCPIAGNELGDVATLVISSAVSKLPEPCKVLITDFDETLWCGVVADVGVEGIQCRLEGKGYKHFIYQSYLAKLKREGVLLVGVSRNDLEVALEPFRVKAMLLGEDDFVGILCSYHSKSSQIAQVAKQLNLDFSSFVFVDDNPLEIAEVGSTLPGIHCVRFPLRTEDFPQFLKSLSELFARRVVTDEDRLRTEMYRTRVKGILPSDIAGADLTDFLRDLEMKLVIEDRSLGSRDRAVQLINKTNQFNLNGTRLSMDEVSSVLTRGGSLYTASLADRHGSHGEILACLIDQQGVIQSLVMSCRVFQRRVEHAFFAWLARRENPPQRLDFKSTAKNSPISDFLRDPAFYAAENNLVGFDPVTFLGNHSADLKLFTLTQPDQIQLSAQQV